MKRGAIDIALDPDPGVQRPPFNERTAMPNVYGPIIEHLRMNGYYDLAEQLFAVALVANGDDA